MSQKPNVIIILSDDQGYGDFACNGNPWLNTPCLDRFASESVSLTDFHTSPMCAPTRAGLMSGRYPDRVGVWSTLNGCFIMNKETRIMPQIFKDSGYRTGMFGKWHLGDNYPYRAIDKGFDEVLSFGGGVIGEVPDYWDNDYFDDVYLDNGRWEEHQGYCTDIWFDRAIKFIQDGSREEPFLCYLANNAPHRPFNVDNKYSGKYEAMGISTQIARFYGMIENIDENFGRLDEALKDSGLADNTIVIYFGDNGTCGGAYMDEQGFVKDGFNAGLRGKKCDPYEGGHKNACYIRWPEGGLKGGYEVNGLSANFDLLPTLMGLAGVDDREGTVFDGTNLSAFLKEKNSTINDRQLVIHNMQLERPEKYKDYCVLTNSWRMTRTAVYGHDEIELYDFKKDIEQKRDLAAAEPAVIRELSSVYDAWWDEMAKQYDSFSPIAIGSPREPETKLTSHSWHGSTEMSYNQTHIRDGINDTGYWELEVLETGSYHIELRRWPKEIDTALKDSVPAVPGTDRVHERNAGKIYDIVNAGISCGKYSGETEVLDGQTSAVFTVFLEEGPVKLDAWFDCSDSSRIGAYYTYISRK
ncbi:MAG: arylsulfatase [Spirochaetales bacterium]|nr:arylsulfatase [Spirochaetales bacterium]